MAEYSSSFDRHGAFRFDRESLEDLTKAIAKFVGTEPSITVSLSEDHQIQTENLSEVFDDLYTKSFPIRSFSIQGSDWKADPRRRVHVVLRTSGSSPVSFSISGDRDSCAATRHEVENIINSRREWFGRLLVPSTSIFSFLLLAVGFVALFVLVAFLHLTLWPSLRGEWLGTVFGIEAMVLLAAFLSARKLLFPAMVLEIGKSAEVAKRAVHWRTVTFVTVGAGIIIGLVTRYLGRGLGL